MPFQNGTCSSLIGPLVGGVEVGLKWKYLHAARDFLGHAVVFLKSLVESLRQSVVVGYAGLGSNSQLLIPACLLQAGLSLLAGRGSNSLLLTPA